MAALGGCVADGMGTASVRDGAGALAARVAGGCGATLPGTALAAGVGGAMGVAGVGSRGAAGVGGAGSSTTRIAGACTRRACQGKPKPGSPSASPPKVKLSSTPCTASDSSSPMASRRRSSRVRCCGHARWLGSAGTEVDTSGWCLCRAMPRKLVGPGDCSAADGRFGARHGVQAQASRPKACDDPDARRRRRTTPRQGHRHATARAPGPMLVTPPDSRRCIP
jgi:hypothetical protein